MKRVVAIITISLLLAACSASRRLQRTDIKVAEQTSMTDTVEAAQETSTQKTEQSADKTVQASQLAENELVVIETTEYDTSLPTDNTTGTPPVKSRTIQTRSRSAQQHSELTSQTSTHLEEDSRQVGTITQTTAADTSASANTEMVDNTRRGLNWFQKTLCIVGATALLYLLIRLFIKIRTRF